MDKKLIKLMLALEEHCKEKNYTSAIVVDYDHDLNIITTGTIHDTIGVINCLSIAVKKEFIKILKQRKMGKNEN